jgi:hypothetical protein
MFVRTVATVLFVLWVSGGGCRAQCAGPACGACADSTPSVGYPTGVTSDNYDDFRLGMAVQIEWYAESNDTSTPEPGTDCWRVFDLDVDTAVSADPPPDVNLIAETGGDAWLASWQTDIADQADSAISPPTVVRVGEFGSISVTTLCFLHRPCTCCAEYIVPCAWALYETVYDTKIAVSEMDVASVWGTSFNGTELLELQGSTSGALTLTIIATVGGARAVPREAIQYWTASQTVNLLDFGTRATHVDLDISQTEVTEDDPASARGRMYATHALDDGGCGTGPSFSDLAVGARTTATRRVSGGGSSGGDPKFALGTPVGGTQFRPALDFEVVVEGDELDSTIGLQTIACPLPADEPTDVYDSSRTLYTMYRATETGAVDETATENTKLREGDYVVFVPSNQAGQPQTAPDTSNRLSAVANVAQMDERPFEFRAGYTKNYVKEQLGTGNPAGANFNHDSYFELNAAGLGVSTAMASSRYRRGRGVWSIPGMCAVGKNKKAIQLDNEHVLFSWNVYAQEFPCDSDGCASGCDNGGALGGQTLAGMYQRSFLYQDVLHQMLFPDDDVVAIYNLETPIFPLTVPTAWWENRQSWRRTWGTSVGAGFSTTTMRPHQNDAFMIHFSSLWAFMNAAATGDPATIDPDATDDWDVMGVRLTHTSEILVLPQLNSTAGPKRTPAVRMSYVGRGSGWKAYPPQFEVGSCDPDSTHLLRDVDAGTHNVTGASYCAAKLAPKETVCGSGKFTMAAEAAMDSVNKAFRGHVFVLRRVATGFNATAAALDDAYIIDDGAALYMDPVFTPNRCCRSAPSFNGDDTVAAMRSYTAEVRVEETVGPTTYSVDNRVHVPAFKRFPLDRGRVMGDSTDQSVEIFCSAHETAIEADDCLDSPITAGLRQGLRRPATEMPVSGVDLTAADMPCYDKSPWWTTTYAPGMEHAANPGTCVGQVGKVAVSADSNTTFATARVNYTLARANIRANLTRGASNETSYYSDVDYGNGFHVYMRDRTAATVDAGVRVSDTVYCKHGLEPQAIRFRRFIPNSRTGDDSIHHGDVVALSRGPETSSSDPGAPPDYPDPSPANSRDCDISDVEGVCRGTYGVGNAIVHAAATFLLQDPPLITTLDSVLPGVAHSDVVLQLFPPSNLTIPSNTTNVTCTVSTVELRIGPNADTPPSCPRATPLIAVASSAALYETVAAMGTDGDGTVAVDPDWFYQGMDLPGGRELVAAGLSSWTNSSLETVPGMVRRVCIATVGIHDVDGGDNIANTTWTLVVAGQENVYAVGFEWHDPCLPGPYLPIGGKWSVTTTDEQNATCTMSVIVLCVQGRNSTGQRSSTFSDLFWLNTPASATIISLADEATETNIPASVCLPSSVPLTGAFTSWPLSSSARARCSLIDASAVLSTSVPVLIGSMRARDKTGSTTADASTPVPQNIPLYSLELWGLYVRVTRVFGCIDLDWASSVPGYLVPVHDGDPTTSVVTFTYSPASAPVVIDGSRFDSAVDEPLTLSFLLDTVSALGPPVSGLRLGDTVPPQTFTFSGAPQSIHTLTARVEDASGATCVGELVYALFAAEPNAAPIIRLTGHGLVHKLPERRVYGIDSFELDYVVTGIDRDGDTLLYTVSSIAAVPDSSVTVASYVSVEVDFVASRVPSGTEASLAVNTAKKVMLDSVESYIVRVRAEDPYGAYGVETVHLTIRSCSSTDWVCIVRRDVDVVFGNILLAVSDGALYLWYAAIGLTLLFGVVMIIGAVALGKRRSKRVTAMSTLSAAGRRDE